MFYLIVQTFDLFDQFLFVWYNKLLSLLLTALHQQLQQQILIMSTSLGFGLITCGLMIKGSFKMYRHIRNRYYLDPHRMYPGGFYSQMTLREAQLIIGIVDKADRRRSNSNIVHQCLIITPITEVLHTQQLKSMRLRICYSIVDQTYLYSVITHIIQSFAFNYNIDNKMQKDKKNEDEEELISDSEEAPVTGRSPQQPEAIMYGDTSIQMRCPYCLELIHSEIILKPEFISLALGICFFAIVPNLMMMLLIITLIQLTASRKHRCPLCERELGSDGKFLLFFTDQVYSWSFLSAGFISTKKNLMTFGLIAFAVIVIGFRASLQQEHKFVATTWPEYIRECSQTEPIFCLQKYRDKEFKNWEGHLLKLQDNQQYPTKWYLHAVSLYMKMEPSLHVDKPDMLLTLDTDVVYFNKELIRSLVHGDKIRFNCTLHDRERGNLKDVLHFHIDDIEVTGHDKNYALYNTPIEEEWIQIHVQDRGRLTSQPMNSSQIKPI